MQLSLGDPSGLSKAIVSQTLTAICPADQDPPSQGWTLKDEG